MTSPMVLIFNPAARAGRSRRYMDEALAQLEQRGLPYEMKPTERPGHATEIARRSLEGGARLIVAAGGDGTVHEVVNGMVHDDEAVAPGATLGVIPAGTECDFVKTFGIPTMPAHAVAHLDGLESFPIDLGSVRFEQEGRSHKRYFANVAEVGLGAEVLRRSLRIPRFFHPLEYHLAFWWSVLRHTPAEVEVDLTDRTYRGPMSNLVAANCQFFAGGMKIAPKAAPTDGVLDFQIQFPSTREAIALLPKTYRGAHVPHPHIKEAKRVRVSVTSDRPLPIEADGQLLGHTPAVFEVVKNVISLKV
ncbi:MAG: diacylglycerol kinase family lipid kinase [Actinomycetota bacterium]|nr:diacylglycerol kinase family lipid kinase [Actinomycetota bacterium]